MSPRHRAGVGLVRARRSIPINIEDRFGKGLRGFLRQTVPDAARDHPVHLCSGWSKDAAERSNVAASKAHCGEASRQMRLAKSRRYCS